MSKLPKRTLFHVFHYCWQNHMLLVVMGMQCQIVVCIPLMIGKCVLKWGRFPSGMHIDRLCRRLQFGPKKVESVNKSELKLAKMLFYNFKSWSHVWRPNLHPKSSCSKNVQSSRMQEIYIIHAKRALQSRTLSP